MTALNRLVEFMLDLGTAFPPSGWEKVEDIIAHALHLAGYAGSVEDEPTGNTTAIRDLSRESSAVQAVDWTKHVHTLFCPTCGDTLFCNRCGREARGLADAKDGTRCPACHSTDIAPNDHTLQCQACGCWWYDNGSVDQSDESTSDDTPLAEVLDDHPVEGIDD